MNKFTITTLVLLCYACNKTSIVDETPLVKLTKPEAIYQIANLNFTNSKLSKDKLCDANNLEVEIDFNYYNCVQRSTSNQQINAFVFDGHVYVLMSEGHFIDVMHIEYTDIDDFWVSTKCPSFQKASLGQIEIARLSISSILSCVDTIQLQLLVGMTCHNTSFRASK